MRKNFMVIGKMALILFILSIFSIVYQEAAFSLQEQDARINTNTTGLVDATHPKIACDSSGHVYVVWYDGRDGKTNIYFNYSWDSGATWLASDIKVNNPEGIPYDIRSAQDPEIACDDNGNVYIVWLDAVTYGASGIYFASFSNNGANRRSSSDVLITTRNGLVENPQVTCDSTGHIYALWGIMPSQGGYKDIYFNSSSDYGLSWRQNDIRLDTDTPLAGHSTNARINCEEDGHVYAVWEDYRNGNADVYLRSASGYGDTWRDTDIRLDTDSPGATNSFSPEIASDQSGHIYVTWTDDRLGHIRCNYSTDYGIGWLTNDFSVSHNTSAASTPQVSCDRQGHVYVSWVDGRNGIQDVYSNYSSNFGLGWQLEDIRVDRGGWSMYSKMASDEDGRVYVAWVDGRNIASGGQPDIYSNCSSDNGASWSPLDLRLDSDNPNPGSSVSPQIVSSRNGDAYVVWEDNRNGTYDIYFNYFHKPIADAGEDQAVFEGTLVTLDGSGSFVPGTRIAYQWTQVSGPSVALSNPTIVNPTFTAPMVSSNTDLKFSLVVTDVDSGRVSDPDTVIITDKDRPPGGCFLAGTLITMADGSSKPIERIKTGDIVLAFDEASKQMKPDKVTQIFKHDKEDVFLVVNGHLRVTPIHRVLSKGNWIEIGKLKVGDTLTNAKGEDVAIKTIKVVKKKVDIYNFEVNPCHTYVADGVIVHNRKSNITTLE